MTNPTSRSLASTNQKQPFFFFLRVVNSLLFLTPPSACTQVTSGAPDDPGASVSNRLTSIHWTGMSGNASG
jgi:hypothetical protein